MSDYQKLSKPCSEAGLNLVQIGQFFYDFDAEEGQQMQHLCRGYTMLRNEVDSYKRMDFQEYENRSSLEDMNFAIMMNDAVSKFKFHLCFKTIPFFGSES